MNSAKHWLLSTFWNWTTLPPSGLTSQTWERLTVPEDGLQGERIVGLVVETPFAVMQRVESRRGWMRTWAAAASGSGLARRASAEAPTVAKSPAATTASEMAFIFISEF
ncbi:hypothetical protein C8R44DRAFT_822959 [Mycena epipterygia]|nr:hypothetical protein C8R44DRAFT_822953 [Mycena epipterygia]KAJ7082591.1 hypothetical protein C8R44DRAFT_822959 [Mycena epipterygia]